MTQTDYKRHITDHYWIGLIVAIFLTTIIYGVLVTLAYIILYG